MDRLFHQRGLQHPIWTSLQFHTTLARSILPHSTLVPRILAPQQPRHPFHDRRRNPSLLRGHGPLGVTIPNSASVLSLFPRFNRHRKSPFSVPIQVTPLEPVQIPIFNMDDSDTNQVRIIDIYASLFFILAVVLHQLFYVFL